MKELVDQLNKRMFSQFDFASIRRNRVLQLITAGQMSVAQLQWTLNEYLALPRIIVELLSAVRDSAKLDGMKAVHKELTRNIGEEMGSDTQGVTHYELLIRGAALELGHKVSNDVSACTAEFCHQMKRLAFATPTSVAVGTAYALESSARPELLVVRKQVDILAKATHQKLKRSGILADFFNRHIKVWEVGHECYLREACEVCLSEDDHAGFEHGFISVMNAMERWWSRLAENAVTQ